MVKYKHYKGELYEFVCIATHSENECSGLFYADILIHPYIPLEIERPTVVRFSERRRGFYY